jgi:hypothetical protein
MDLSPADVLELHDLYSRYTHTIDSFDEPGWLGTWADGGVFDVGPRTSTGEAELTEFIHFLDQMTADHRLRHYTSNVSVRADGTGATGRAYLLVLDTATRAIVTTGYYDDRIARTADGWRFAARVLHADEAPASA